MSTNTPRTAEGLQAQIETIAVEIEPTLTELAEIASLYEEPEQEQAENAPHYADNFRRIFTGFKQDTFNLIIVGRFSNGKSTLLNALMGRLPDTVLELVKKVSLQMEEQAKQEDLEDDEDDEDDEDEYKSAEKGPLPTSDMPTTPVLTLISYAEEPRVQQQTKNEEWQEKTLEWYLTEARVKNTQEKNKQAFDDVLQFHLELPAPLCKEGSITLIDSPGIQNTDEHNRLVDEALALSDAAIVLFRSDSLLTMEERRFVAKMQALGIKHYFSLINRWRGRKVDRDLKAFTWEHLVRDLRNGPAYNNQNVSDFFHYDIYFVDVLKALNGRFTGDEKRVETSGLTKFEERLNTFLRHDRFAVHIERFLAEAEKNILDLQSLLNKRLPLLSVESARFEERLERYRPQLEDLQKRAKKLDKFFRSNLHNCQQELATDYERLMLNICQQLPTEMAQRRLPGLENFSDRLTANWRREQLLKDAFQMAQDYVQGEIDAWQNAGSEQHGPQRIISMHIRNLMYDITEEIKRLEKEYDDIRFALSGAQAEVGNAQLKGPGWAERVAAAALGLAIGAVDVAIAGGMGGFKQAGRYALGAIAVAIPLALLGAPFLPIILPVSIITGMLTNALWGAQSLEKEIKNTVVNLMINGDEQQGMRGLRGAHLRDRPAIDMAAQQVFDEIQRRVEEEVNRYIREEEWNIETSERQCALSLEERQTQITSINNSLGRLSELSTKLQDALAASQQG